MSSFTSGNSSDDSAAASTDPRFEEESCMWCDGDGCEACNQTGFLYTENAIRLQQEAEDAES